eukprot:350344-Chlamydomonas_euryale.AAC.4
MSYFDRIALPWTPPPWQLQAAEGHQRMADVGARTCTHSTGRPLNASNALKANVVASHSKLQGVCTTPAVSLLPFPPPPTRHCLAAAHISAFLCALLGLPGPNFLACLDQTSRPAWTKLAVCTLNAPFQTPARTDPGTYSTLPHKLSAR